ncbi:MAG: DDE-type integrase/transposase/recombinase, partial [Cyanobacteria bacterium J06638_38]
MYTNQIRRRPKPADKWHLDEVVITIQCQQSYLWRAVDAEGQVLDILMQPHRDKRAAKKFFRKLLKPLGFAPRVVGFCCKKKTRVHEIPLPYLYLSSDAEDLVDKGDLSCPIIFIDSGS